MCESIYGYREIDHTADWELEVWAPNLPVLLEQAALGMYDLAGAQQSEGTRIVRSFEFQALDSEEMLVTFLSELLFLGEEEGLVFDRFDFTFADNIVHVKMSGVPFTELHKEIKAVTYHNLSIRQTPAGLETRIVFDV